MSATQIPLTFRIAPLPTGFQGSPQQLATEIAARLSAVSANSISFFASGSVAPTSNVGPWLKNDQTWYVWSDTLATYIPEIIDPQSLGYTFSVSAPNPNQFKLWIRLDGSGDALGISYFSNGAWKDIYAGQFANYSTTTQMNAAIQQAVGSQSKYSFSAIKAVPQTVTAGAGAATIEFPNEQYDIGNHYDNATFKFTAPVTGVYTFRSGILIDLTSGTPTDIEIGLSLVVNGAGVVGFSENESDVSQKGRTMLCVRDVLLSAGNTVEARVEVITTGASTWTMDTNSGGNFFSGNLIEAT